MEQRFATAHSCLDIPDSRTLANGLANTRVHMCAGYLVRGVCQVSESYHVCTRDFVSDKCRVYESLCRNAVSSDCRSLDKKAVNIRAVRRCTKGVLNDLIIACAFAYQAETSFQRERCGSD